MSLVALNFCLIRYIFLVLHIVGDFGCSSFRASLKDMSFSSELPEDGLGGAVLDV